MIHDLGDDEKYSFILEPSDPCNAGPKVPGKFLKYACYMFYPDSNGKIWPVYRILRASGVYNEFLGDVIKLRGDRFRTELPPVIGYDSSRKRFILSLQDTNSGEIRDIFALQKLN